jgi:hypothetical protein
MMAAWITAVSAALSGGRGAPGGGPKVVSADASEMAAVKVKLAAGHKSLRPALDRLIKDADKALQQRPLSVLDKKKSVAGADAQDYVSFAPYFWPNPETADGLPYVRKDGRHNRGLVSEGDRDHFWAVKSAVDSLALAYYFTDNLKYAEHAAVLLRGWFLDRRTRMSPNADHAQAVPGGPTGRPTGLIEFRDMPQLVDALGLLETAPAWTEADRRGMREWLGQFYKWLTTSRNGKGEDKASNNHGTWYDVEVTALALYLGKMDEARRVAERFGERRIAAQVQPDGRQPRELGRVNSWGYSVFNVTAMLSMAEMAERAGVDLWKFRSADGRSIRAALDYLASYMDGKREWPHGGGERYPANSKALAGVLIRATRGFGAEPYQKLLQALPRSAWESRRERLLHSRPE